MSYEELIDTLTEIVNNQVIYKKGLKLVYELEAEHLRKLEEHIFYIRQIEGEFVPSDGMFEIESDGVIIQLISK